MELPDHALQEHVIRAFKSAEKIDRYSIAQEILPQGAHPTYWQAAKKLADHALDHMCAQGKVWKDRDGWWHLCMGGWQ